MLHFQKFRPNMLETRDAQCERLVTGQRPYRELRN